MLQQSQHPSLKTWLFVQKICTINLTWRQCCESSMFAAFAENCQPNISGLQLGKLAEKRSETKKSVYGTVQP